MLSTVRAQAPPMVSTEGVVWIALSDSAQARITSYNVCYTKLLRISPSVAVGSGTNQIIASSVSGVIAHFRRGNVDVRMGGVLLAGGMIGSGLGVLLFNLLKSVGQIDLTIRLSFV